MAPPSPFPAQAGPWPIPRPTLPALAVQWTRSDARTYAAGDGDPPINMAAALYTSSIRGAPSFCLFGNLSCGRVTEATEALLYALSVYLVSTRVIWPLWSGLLAEDGLARGRGVAGGLHMYSPRLFEKLDLYTPPMFGAHR